MHNNVTRDFYLDSKLFFWTFYSSKNPEEKKLISTKNKPYKLFQQW